MAITLASGEVVDPVPMEALIRSSDLVQDVVMFGEGQNQVGVLIQPTDPQNDLADFRDEIWAKIEEANNLPPAEEFCRIDKTMILITRVDGTGQHEAPILIRHLVEINNLYDKPSTWNPEGVEQWLLQCAVTIRPGVNVPDDDLFSQGFDSFNAMRLRGRVLNVLKHWHPQLQQEVRDDLIYQIPTIRRLSVWIDTLVNEGVEEAKARLKDQQKQAIDKMMKDYSFGSPRRDPVWSPIERDAVVLLTGSTGGLGSSLLFHLVHRHEVKRVFAFNRPSTRPIKERQQSALSDRGLELGPYHWDKIKFVEADASQANCGLSTDPVLYHEILSSVTLIIHNAWRVDFNLVISSFEDCIQATRNLVQLGLASDQPHRVRFLFTSSIASTLGWPSTLNEVPEEVQPYPPVTVGTGYAASKYVAELIIASSGLCATSIRIGQIIGASNGCWSTTDWFPILVKTGENLGQLPTVEGVVSWVDEEYVASAIMDTAFAERPLPPALNLVNPQSQPFDEVIKKVQKAIADETRGSIHEIELQFTESSLEWLQLLQEKANNPSDDDLQEFPAIKLLEFIGSAVMTEDGAEVAGRKCSVDKMKEVSQTVRNNSCRVTERKAKAWVKYWIHTKRFL